MNNRSRSRDRGHFRQDRGRPRFEHNYRGNSFQDNAKGYRRQNSRGKYRNDRYGHDGYNRGRDGPRERGHSQEIIAVLELEVQATVGLGQDPEPALIGDRIRCYNCR